MFTPVLFTHASLALIFSAVVGWYVAWRVYDRSKIQFSRIKTCLAALGYLCMMITVVLWVRGMLYPVPLLGLCIHLAVSPYYLVTVDRSSWETARKTLMEFSIFNLVNTTFMGLGLLFVNYPGNSWLGTSVFIISLYWGILTERSGRGVVRLWQRVVRINFTG